MADDADAREATQAEPPPSSRTEAAVSRRLVEQGAPLVCAVAVVMALAALLTRGLEPALPGVWVGSDHVINALKLAGAMFSQLGAVASTALAAALVLAAVQSPLPAWARAALVGGSVLTTLAVMIASAVPLPHGSRLVLTGAAAFTVVVAAAHTLRSRPLRVPSLVVLSMAAAAVFRLGTMLLAGIIVREDILLYVARGLASATACLEIGAVLLAVAWSAVRPGFGVPILRRVRWILVVSLVLGTALVTVMAWKGRDMEADGAVLLAARTIHQLLTQPEPYVPLVVRTVVEVLTWITVIASLVLRPRGTLESAVIALALVARGSLEVPLGAIALTLAALALVLELRRN